jgi:hypothetical protein
MENAGGERIVGGRRRKIGEFGSLSSFSALSDASSFFSSVEAAVVIVGGLLHSATLT